MTDLTPLALPDQTRVLPQKKLDELSRVSQAFEAEFLTEMLKHTGVGKPSDSFGGGAGEEAFSGFLVREYADLLSQQGGIGLAETVFKALVKRESGQ